MITFWIAHGYKDGQRYLFAQFYLNEQHIGPMKLTDYESDDEADIYIQSFKKDKELHEKIVMELLL